MSHGLGSRSINGLVIDVNSRDADDIEAMGFPMFSRRLCIPGTSNAVVLVIIIGGC
jgi:4-hydroxy-4-methyl-2-oxoglutarate aldolase